MNPEVKTSQQSGFPKREPGKPGIFYGQQALYPCFCINDIYRDLFTGSKAKAGVIVNSAIICFPNNPHITKKGRELLAFLLPPALIEKIKSVTKNGEPYVKAYDYKEYFIRSTNNNKIARVLFSLFSTSERDSEKKCIEAIQTHFIQMLKNASFQQPQLNNYLCSLVDGYIAPSKKSPESNKAFHTLVDSGEHDSISKAIANVFISAMLGLYSMKYGTGADKSQGYYVRTYLLNKVGMEYIWIPETISNSYVKLQDALYFYESGLYADSFKKTITWLNECGSKARGQELASAYYILGACLFLYSDCCNLDSITKKNHKKLQSYLPPILWEDTSAVFSNKTRERMRSAGIVLLEKSISMDCSISEAFYILYSHYAGKNEQKALAYLSVAFDQTNAKAVFEVANRNDKGQKRLPDVSDDDIIDKLTTIISNEQNYSEIAISESLYLRGRLRSKLEGNDIFATTDFEAAAKRGHERARQELSGKKRMERQQFPSFIDDPFAPCCFVNTLDGNNLVFLSTLPDGEWRLFTTEQKAISVDKAISVKDIDEFIKIQHLSDFDSCIHKLLFLFMSEDEDRNLNECLMVLDTLFNIALKMSEKKRNALIDNIEIFVCAKYEIASTLIDANINDMGNDIYFKVHVIDETRDSAHQLLCDAPLFLPLLGKKTNDNSINVVLFGCSETNYRIIKESFGCAYLGKEYPVSITMLGSEADHMKKRLQQECPGFFNELHLECISLRFIPCCIAEEDFPNLIYGKAHDENPNNELVKTLSDGNYFVVDLSSDCESIRFAMELRTWFLRSNATYDRTPFICVKCRSAQNSYLAAHLTLSGQAAGDTYYSRYDLFPFGITRVLCSFDRLIDNPRLEEIALQIHKSYYGDNDRLAENDYYSFSYNADSSLLTAIGLSYRFFAGGSFFSKKEQYLNYGAYNSIALLSDYAEAIKSKDDHAASLEQSRWNGFMLSRGWETADLNQVRAYKDQSTGITHKHTLAKLHPFIREWGDLDSDDMMQILGMLQSKYDYNKHPKATTRKSIKDTPRFLSKPMRDHEKTR